MMQPGSHFSQHSQTCKECFNEKLLSMCSDLHHLNATCNNLLDFHRISKIFAFFPGLVCTRKCPISWEPAATLDWLKGLFIYNHCTTLVATKKFASLHTTRGPIFSIDSTLQVSQTYRLMSV